MPVKKKLSGAQRRKRSKKQEREISEASTVMLQLVKKNKIEEVVIINASDSDNDLYSMKNSNNDYGEPSGLSKASFDKNQLSKVDTHITRPCQSIKIEHDPTSGDESKVEVNKMNSSIIVHSENTIIHTRSISDNNNANENSELSNINICIPAVLRNYDIGYLQFDPNNHSPIMSQQLHVQLISMRPSKFQHTNGPFNTVDGHCMNSTWFQRRLTNGEVMIHSWLIYSPFKKAAFCFCCLLFGSGNQESVVI